MQVQQMIPEPVRILLIDDEPAVIMLIQNMLNTLSSPQYSVEWVGTYQAGLEAIKQDAYDLYFVDYMLNGKDGIRLLEEAAQFDASAAIIVLTAYGTYAADLQAMQLGAMDFLDKKQLTPQLLERSIRYAIHRKQTEEKLRKISAQVAELEHLKSEMLRIAAHDLKNPISVIMVQVDLLQRYLELECYDRLGNGLELIRQNAARMRNITTSILSLERIEELNRKLFCEVELNEIVLQVITEHQQDAEHKNLVLNVIIPEEKVLVYGIPALLTEAVTNIVENAIRYTSDSGQVDVCLSKQGTNALFEVQDNGTGVPEEYHERIFDPFFRLENSTNPDTHNTNQGTGLGLHLVKSVVVRHNGQLVFRSAYGSGSTFGFIMPLHIPPDINT